MPAFTDLAVTTAFIAVFFPFSPVSADVYRCELADGRLSFQQIPCHSDSKPMVLDDRQSGWSALRPGEQALLNSYRKQDAGRHRKPSGAKKKVVGESKACWNKRKQLEAVRAKRHRGYKLKESGELRRKRNNYEDYLRQFCP